MPVNLEEQLRQLGGALDDVVDEVRIDEVCIDEAVGSAVSASERGRRAWLLPAAAVVLVLVGIVAVALIARSNRTQLDVAGPPDIPSELLPADASLLSTRQTAVGRFEVYDAPSEWRDSGRRRCLYLRNSNLGDGVSYGDCYTLDEIERGTAAELLTIGDNTVVWGLTPTDGDRIVIVDTPDGEQSVDPDGSGIWFVIVDDTRGEVTVRTDCCQHTQRLSVLTWVDPNPIQPAEFEPIQPPLPLQLLNAHEIENGLGIELTFLGEPAFKAGNLCTARYLPSVRESAGVVDLLISVERPEGAGQNELWCGDQWTDRLLVFELTEPLGDRRVRVQGRPFDVDEAEPTSTTVWQSASPDSIPADWEIRGVVETAVARFEIFDVGTTGEVCVNQLAGNGMTSGCFDRDTIERGLAWGAAVEEPSADIWGLAPVGVEFEVTVGAETVVPDALGFWHVVITENITEFTIEAPCCTNVIPIGAPMITVPTSTTSTGSDVLVPSPLSAQPFDGVRTSADGRELWAWFIGASEYEVGNPCSMRYVASVAESAERVVLSIDGEQPARAEANNVECNAAGHFRQLSVSLAEPLDGRPVLFQGEPIAVVDGATLAEPTWLPDEWSVTLEGRGFLSAPTWFREWRSSARPACTSGLTEIELTEGAAPFLAELPRDSREADLGSFDLGEASGQLYRFATNTGARLEWTVGETGYAIRADFCGASEADSIATILRFARGLRLATPESSAG